MSQSKPRILFFNAVRHALQEYEALKLVANPEVVTSTSRDQFFSDLRSKYQNIEAIFRTSSSGVVAGKFDEEFVNQLPTSLKYICHTGAGYDQIDVDACTRRNIIVTYAPDPVTSATADLTIFLLLGAIRQLNPSFTSLRSGNFKKGLDFGHDPQGKTLGILGMGRIGRAVKRRAEPFGLKTIYHNRKPLSNDLAAGCQYVSFDELLSTSDIISVHVPLSASTTHLIEAAEIAKMKPGVVLINTARGAVIDEAAMAAALDEGHIAAVGLDVYEKEPLVDERLVKNERALLVPHLGTHTVETLGQMESLAIENARRGVLKERLLTVVPEQAEAYEQSAGPPKHYIVTMEKRLMETEQVLCALLAQVSGDQLERAFRDIPKAGLRSTGGASSAHGGASIEVVKGEKFGPAYWASHPIDSVEAVQRWWAERTSKEPSETSNQNSHASEVAATNDTPTDDTPGGDESYGDDDIEESEGTTRAESMGEDGETLVIDPDMSSALGIRDTGGGAVGLLSAGMTGSRANLDTRTSEKKRQTRPPALESYESAFLW
ncbi:uncharacterized protein CCOS01_15057 [Colletotrichum costaricense]|uniref:D-isomer specific 2-hydroxyacid dehydrogenase n=1 Tax=Colletotrichum costaricense TaxID=1209916 RepID=A0AAI9YIQ0_9PEZI|nr:uncharacterized protein CCOS01_15057 [Colletotrichum costaricense]KAK1511295.1 hypothetical protein CCOS01_15057 [Colletotrichum costaricense]